MNLTVEETSKTIRTKKDPEGTQVPEGEAFHATLGMGSRRG